MIKVVVRRNREGSVTDFRVKGHADYDVEGKDIICSAASAIAYTACGYFEEKYNADGNKQTLFNEKSGDLSWTRPRITDRDERIAADAVLEAMVIGFRQIEYSYGSKYLVVSEEEVESHA